MIMTSEKEDMTRMEMRARNQEEGKKMMEPVTQIRQSGRKRDDA
jgi:hypothetical protein